MNEWYGTGNYENKPTNGGFEVLEVDFQAKWRKHFTSSQKKAFSRTKQVVMGINKAAADGNKSVEMVVEEYEVEWAGDLKKSPANMIRMLQDQGIVIKAVKKRNFGITEGVVV